MRLALPVSIPASCFFDQQAVPNENSKGDIRGFPNWDWKISKQSLSILNIACKNTTHHTQWPCLLQPYFELLAFLAVLTSSELLYVCREQMCQFQLVPVSGPCLLEQNFLEGWSTLFLEATAMLPWCREGRKAGNTGAKILVQSVRRRCQKRQEICKYGAKRYNFFAKPN